MSVPTVVEIETFVRARWGLVRITRSDGARGWGQMAQGDPDLCASILHRHLAPLVVGRGLGDDDWPTLADGLLAARYKFRGTHLLRAIAGLDTAAADLLATASGRSVAAWLGAECRPWPVYLSSMARDTAPEGEVERCRAACERIGCRSLKLKIGQRLGGDPATDAGRSEALITLAGRDLAGYRLMADANGSWDAAQAIAMGRRLEDAGFVHYEEPCPFWDIDATATVARALDVPVAGGEQDHDLFQYRRMLALGAVDILQCDVGYVGGLARALAVARIAAEAGVPLLPHSPNPSMLLPMSLHLAAASPAPVPLIELNLSCRVDAIPIFEPAMQVRDGHLELVTEEPGWGLRIRDDWLTGCVRTVSGESPHRP